MKKDYCTHAPDKLFNIDISECCKKHDEAYDIKKVKRKEADKKLQECIKSKGLFVTSYIYYIFVRIFGYTHWN